MAKLIGSPAVYDGISNSPWKYTGGSSTFEERDPDSNDVVNWNLDMTKYKLGLYKMRRGRITVSGTQTFQRATIDVPELNSMGIPSQDYVTIYFPEQNISFRGWIDGVQVSDHLTGDLVTISVSLYVFTAWVPIFTDTATPIPEPSAHASA